MIFRLVPKSVTLNDLERRNRPNGCVISPNSLAFWADYAKVVEECGHAHRCTRKLIYVCQYIEVGLVAISRIQ